MLRHLSILLLILTITGQLAAQSHPYPYFNEAYKAYPDIPRGMLEAISYTQTRVRHVAPNEAAGCSGIPQYVGVMGLIEDGKGVFRENLKLVEGLSKVSRNDIVHSYLWQVMAFAKAYHRLNQQLGPFDAQHPAAHLPILTALSELPLDTTVGADFALNSYFYSVLSFLNDSIKQQQYGFPAYQMDLRQVFGANYDVLSSGQVIIGQQGITNGQGQPYSNGRMAAEYPGALWNPAASCNYGSRNGTAISAVTVHTVQGSYAGCISWFQNCNAGVSAHYVIRSSDGQVTQMVPEANRAYHVGSENPYTVGIEHEGFVSDPSWYTPAMYQSSANLVKYLAGKYTINPLSTYKGSAQVVLNACYRIKGHVHYPNQTHTDPGVNWNWPLYHNLINDTIATTRLTTCSGTFTDNGGPSGNYTDLTKYLTIIEPAGAASVTMNFTSFSLEQGYDSLYIYDGAGTGGTLLGRYTGTQNPGTVTANSGAMCLLFTSDCSINSTGWIATWSCAACPGSLAVAVDSLVPVTCNPGYIRVAASGGTPPYTYVWGNGTPGPERPNMPVGAFTVSVTDGAGCTISQVFAIPATPNPTVQLSATSLACYGDENTTVSASAAGGTLPYSYVWSVPGTGAALANQGAGTYSVTLTDGAGCTASASTTITQPDSLIIHLDSLSDATCVGGYIALSASGGVGGYSFNWTDGDTATVRSGLNAGTYTVVLSDANGCQKQQFFTISTNNAIAISAQVDTPTCPGDTDGAIEVNVSGGNGPYTYLWNTDSTATQLINLPPGIYTVTSTDADGCLASETIVLPEPDSLTIVASITPINCHGEMDGAISLAITSGQNPFIFQWDSGTGPIISNLADGTYTVTVTDGRGCSITESYTLTQPSPITIWGVYPNSDTTDMAWDSITGGNSPHTVSYWCLIPDMIGGPALECMLEVVDVNGCQIDSSFSFGLWTTHIASTESSRIAVYPNPTSGYITIEWDANSGFKSYWLTNALGQQLLQNPITPQTNILRLDLSTYPAGVYWLLMENQQGRKAIPMVKE